jgi:hypothetical protein
MAAHTLQASGAFRTVNSTPQLQAPSFGKFQPCSAIVFDILRMGVGKVRNTRTSKLMIVALTLLGLSACSTMHAIEPTQSPPAKFQFDSTVPVEFVAAHRVGFRCAERGAKFFGIPGVNTRACANENLITMPNPCHLMGGGWYADLLCHELAHANGWPHNHEGGNWLPDSMRGEKPVYIAARAEAEAHKVDPAASRPLPPGLMIAAVEPGDAPTTAQEASSDAGSAAGNEAPIGEEKPVQLAAALASPALKSALGKEPNEGAFEPQTLASQSPSRAATYAPAPSGSLVAEPDDISDVQETPSTQEQGSVAETQAAADQEDQADHAPSDDSDGSAEEEGASPSSGLSSGPSAAKAD